MRLEGKAAIVTGAAQGLGEGIARRLAVEGCDVLLTDVNAEKVEAAAAAIAADTGRKAVGVRADVTSEADNAAVVARAVAEFGKLDIFVANAGILKAGDITEFSPDDWRKVIDVNLVGYFLGAQAAARQMVAQKSGVIVQINSKSGKKGSFRNSAYAASKFGGIGLTQSIALDLAPHGVRVNAVCPGNLLDGTLWQDSLFDQYAKTQGLTREEVRAKYEGQVPLGRGATYEDISNVVVFLCSEDASYMTGQAINVTGGQEMR
jgi:Dehydrogenases with different specificities (related to short-chain alcohol dehydrogenases)